jgi:hypothetical protein
VRPRSVGRFARDFTTPAASGRNRLDGFHGIWRVPVRSKEVSITSLIAIVSDNSCLLRLQPLITLRASVPREPARPPRRLALPVAAYFMR